MRVSENIWTCEPCLKGRCDECETDKPAERDPGECYCSQHDHPAIQTLDDYHREVL